MHTSPTMVAVISIGAYLIPAYFFSAGFSRVVIPIIDFNGSPLHCPVLRRAFLWPASCRKTATTRHLFPLFIVLHHLFGIGSGAFRDDDFNGGEPIPTLQALPPSVDTLLDRTMPGDKYMGWISTFWAVHDAPYKTLCAPSSGLAAISL